jgi:transcription elongation factor Elf1
MVDLVDVTCGNCDFEQKLLTGTSNPDQVYDDLNDDFNYYRVFYRPAHPPTFINLETFNQNSSQLLTHNYSNDQCPAELGCADLIVVEDMTTFTRDFPCPKCGRASSLKIAIKEMIEG